MSQQMTLAGWIVCLARFGKMEQEKMVFEDDTKHLGWLINIHPGSNRPSTHLELAA